jgi:hypothetical protein
MIGNRNPKVARCPIDCMSARPVGRINVRMRNSRTAAELFNAGSDLLLRTRSMGSTISPSQSLPSCAAYGTTARRSRDARSRNSSQPYSPQL